MKPSKPTPYSKKQQKLVWFVSLFLWWGLGFFLTENRLSLAYGSFLLWAVTAGFIWGRKAPFLAVGIFLVGSVSLSWEVLSTESWRWAVGDTGLWTLVVFLSSLSSSFWARLQSANARVQSLEQGFLHAARWSIWGRLTVSMGHELRNQIAIVTGYLDQMKEEGQLTPAYQRKVERSLLANDRMLKVLAQLRFMTRDCMQEPLQALSIADALQEALDFLERPLEYRGVSVSWKAEAELPRVNAHPVLLQTLLVHLLMHSLEHFKGQNTGDGKDICMDIQRQGEGIILRYQDNSLHPKLWDEAGQTLAQQLLLRMGGSLEERVGHPTGWEVLLYLKSAGTAAPHQTHDTLIAS